MTAAERLVRAVLESEGPSDAPDFDAREAVRHLPVEWEVNFIKRSARPWDQAVYRVTAPDESSAIEKAWRKLEAEAPRTWRSFRLYSVNRPDLPSQFAEAQDDADDFDARSYIHSLPEIGTELTAFFGQPDEQSIVNEPGFLRRWFAAWPVKGGNATVNIIVVYDEHGTPESSNWMLSVKPTGQLARIHKQEFIGNYWGALDELKAALERMRRGGPGTLWDILVNWKQWMTHNNQKERGPNPLLGEAEDDAMAQVRRIIDDMPVLAEVEIRHRRPALQRFTLDVRQFFDASSDTLRSILRIRHRAATQQRGEQIMGVSPLGTHVYLEFPSGIAPKYLEYFPEEHREDLGYGGVTITLKVEDVRRYLKQRGLVESDDPPEVSARDIIRQATNPTCITCHGKDTEQVTVSNWFGSWPGFECMDCGQQWTEGQYGYPYGMYDEEHCQAVLAYNQTRQQEREREKAELDAIRKRTGADKSPLLGEALDFDLHGMLGEWTTDHEEIAGTVYALGYAGTRKHFEAGEYEWRKKVHEYVTPDARLVNVYVYVSAYGSEDDQWVHVELWDEPAHMKIGNDYWNLKLPADLRGFLLRLEREITARHTQLEFNNLRYELRSVLGPS